MRYTRSVRALHVLADGRLILAGSRDHVATVPREVRRHDRQFVRIRRRNVIDDVDGQRAGASHPLRARDNHIEMRLRLDVRTVATRRAMDGRQQRIGVVDRLRRTIPPRFKCPLRPVGYSHMGATHWDIRRTDLDRRNPVRRTHRDRAAHNVRAVMLRPTRQTGLTHRIRRTPDSRWRHRHIG